MANYNTFVVVDCKSRKPIMVTSSARRAVLEFAKGKRVEVWNNNCIVEKIRYTDLKKEKSPFLPYVIAEKKYIGEKQRRAEERNKRRIRI